MIQPYVTLKIENNVGFIEFFHPSKNAMSINLLSTLSKTIINAGNNPNIKVIILKSGGNRVFCAGANFNELITIADAKEGEQFFSGFANVINAMRKCPKLIIGRVQGKAVGGGVGIAAAADYCFATQHAEIRLSELSIGIGPFVIEPVVSIKMGKTAMAQMTINAEQFYTANYAKEKGLFAEVLETTQTLDIAVLSLAEKLSTYNPEALHEMKKIIWEGTEHWDELLKARAKISGKLVLSKFTKNILKHYK